MLVHCIGEREKVDVIIPVRLLFTISGNWRRGLGSAKKCAENGPQVDSFPFGKMEENRRRLFQFISILLDMNVVVEFSPYLMEIFCLYK